MRVLVCLSGQVRCFPPFLESFRRHVLDRLPARPDLVACFAAPEAPEAGQLRDLASEARIRFEPDPDLGDVDRLAQGMVAQRHGIRGNLLQWHDLERCADMKRELEAERGRYDLVLWTRPDLYYVTPIEDLNAPPDRLHVPAHDCYRGLMDRMCYGPSREMDLRMNVRRYFLERFHPDHVLAGDPDIAWNPEWVIASLVEDELGGRFARTRLVTLRLRETEDGYEVCRPRCRPEKDPNEGCEDPRFRRVFRRSKRLDWGPLEGTPGERRLPLDLVEARLASGRGGWAGLRARLYRPSRSYASTGRPT